MVTILIAILFLPFAFPRSAAARIHFYRPKYLQMSCTDEHLMPISEPDLSHPARLVVASVRDGRSIELDAAEDDDSKSNGSNDNTCYSLNNEH